MPNAAWSASKQSGDIEAAFSIMTGDLAWVVDASASEPLLKCREGLLRSRFRRPVTQTWAWKKRCFVLAESSCSRRTWVDVDPNHQVQQQNVQDDVLEPMLLMYETAENETPTVAIRLCPRSASSPDANHRISVSVEVIGRHPTHVHIKVTAPLSVPPTHVFVGSDEPKHVTDDQDGTVLMSWRLKFPDGETALLWKETMHTLATSDPDSRRMETDAIDAADHVASASDAALSTPSPHHSSDHFSPASTTRVQLPIRTVSIWTVRLRNVICFGALFSWLYLPGSAGRVLVDRIMITWFQRKVLLLSSLYQQYSEITSDESNIGGAIVVEELPMGISGFYDSVKMFANTNALAIRKLVHPLSPVEDRPKLQYTLVRRILASFAECFTSSGVFPPGSLVHDYFWLTVPVLLVLAISALSILCQLVPGLGPAVSRYKYWWISLVMFAAAAAIGYDTVVNHWVHPIRYGLYWRGYAQSMMALGCLGASKALADKARGHRPSHRVSTRRKVTAGLSALTMSLALPVFVRSMEEQEHSLNSWRIFAALAFLLLFTGLHFFGWAMRHLMVGGIAVGEWTYQFSLVPANVAFYVLSVLGDIAQFFVMRAPMYLWKSACLPLGHTALCSCNRLVFLLDSRLDRILVIVVDVTMTCAKRLEKRTARFWRFTFYPSFQRCVGTVVKIRDEYVYPCLQAAYHGARQLARFVNAAFYHICQKASAVYRVVHMFVAHLLRVLWERLRSALIKLWHASRDVHQRYLRPACHFVWNAVWNALSDFAKWAMSAFRFAFSLLQRAGRAAFEQCLLPTFHFLLNDIFRVARSKLKGFIVSSCRFVWRRMIYPLFRIVWLAFRFSFDTLRRAGRETFERCVLPTFHFILKNIQVSVSLLRALVVSTCRFALRKVIEPLFRISQLIVQTLAQVLQRCVIKLLEISQTCWHALISWLASAYRRTRSVVRDHVILALRSICASGYNVAVALISPFLQKYWQLIPTGLTFNGSFLFMHTAITTTGIGVFTRLQFVMGAWSLFLIGCTVLHAVLSSRGNLVSQHVVLEQSILQYADLHLCYAVSRVLVSGWHALSIVFQLVLKLLDFLIRKSCKRVWELLGAIHRVILKPLIQVSQVILQQIWRSPYLSAFVSLGALTSLYLHHTERIAISIPQSWTIAFGASQQFSLRTFPASCSKLLYGPRYLIASSVQFLSNTYNDVYRPVVNADVSSSALAMCCWVFTCLVTKTRQRVRIKTFAVPVVVLYATGVAATDLLNAASASLLAWIVLSIFVDRHEQQSRGLARVAFQTFQRQRQSRAPEAAAEIRQNFFETECVICLDEFKPGESTMSTLPCGHQFHDACIREWLHAASHQRCPVCRRATGGWDRVLEVVF